MECEHDPTKLRLQTLAKFEGPQRLQALILLITESFFGFVLITQDCPAWLIAYIVTWMAVIMVLSLLTHFLSLNTGPRSKMNADQTIPDPDWTFLVQFIDKLKRALATQEASKGELSSDKAKHAEPRTNKTGAKALGGQEEREVDNE